MPSSETPVSFWGRKPKWLEAQKWLGDLCMQHSNSGKRAGALADTLQGMRSKPMQKQRLCKLLNYTVIRIYEVVCKLFRDKTQNLMRWLLDWLVHMFEPISIHDRAVRLKGVTVMLYGV